MLTSAKLTLIAPYAIVVAELAAVLNDTDSIISEPSRVRINILIEASAWTAQQVYGVDAEGLADVAKKLGAGGPR